MKPVFDRRDIALRALFLLAGSISAILLVLKGHGQAIPALALGATLGACMMAPFDHTSEQ